MASRKSKSLGENTLTGAMISDMLKKAKEQSSPGSVVGLEKSSIQNKNTEVIPMDITVKANAIIVTSSLTPEQINTAKALKTNVLKDKDKNELFSISFTPGMTGDIGKFGMTFNGTSEDGHAQATIINPLPEKAEDKIKAVRTQYGAALVQAQTLEQQMAASVADYASLLESVVVKAE